MPALYKVQSVANTGLVAHLGSSSYKPTLRVTLSTETAWSLGYCEQQPPDLYLSMQVPTKVAVGIKQIPLKVAYGIVALSEGDENKDLIVSDVFPKPPADPAAEAAAE